MNKDELTVLENTLQNEVFKRKGLGDYSQEAAGIRFLAESLLQITQHLIANPPRK